MKEFKEQVRAIFSSRPFATPQNIFQFTKRFLGNIFETISFDESRRHGTTEKENFHFRSGYIFYYRNSLIFELAQNFSRLLGRRRISLGDFCVSAS